MRHSSIFRDLPYADALALADAQGLPALVYVTASGDICSSQSIGASREAELRKKLDETVEQVTWSAPAVLASLSAKVIAIQVPANSETAKLLKVSKPPSVVAIRGGREIDRVEMMWPPWNPTRLIRWIEGHQSGTTSVEQTQNAERELKTRLDKGKELLRLGRHEEALEEFIWLWENAHNLVPSWDGVRYGFLASALPPLVARSRAAQERFEAARDAVEAKLDDAWKLSEWAHLNQILADPDHVLSWLKAVPLSLASDLRVGNNWVIREFVRAQGEWGVLARFLDDPVALLRDEQAARGKLASAWSTTPSMSRDHLEGFKQASKESLRNLAGALYQSLLAAGREAEAAAVVAEATRLDPSREMEAAIAVGDDGDKGPVSRAKPKPVKKAKSKSKGKRKSKKS